MQKFKLGFTIYNSEEKERVRHVQDSYLQCTNINRINIQNSAKISNSL